MKIYVNARFLTQSLSGVQRYAIECSQQIKKLCPGTIFLCPGDILHRDIATKLEAHIIGKKTGHLWEQTELPLFLAKNGNPVLLNLANTAPILYSNNFITIHDLAFYRHPEWNSKMFSMWYNFLIPRLAFKAKHIFTVSKTIKDEIVNVYHIPPTKVSVTYNGIAEHMLQSKPGMTIEKENIILSVGSFNIRKNHQNLLKAYLNSNIKDKYRLVIVGDRNKVFSETGLDEQKLSNSNIEICEGFKDDELIAIYRKAKVVVSFSLYEGFGIPLLEGLFYDCKLICSDIPVYRELYGDAATFCDPVDINSITEVLDNIDATPAKGNIDQLLKQYNYADAAKIIIQKIGG